MVQDQLTFHGDPNRLNSLNVERLPPDVLIAVETRGDCYGLMVIEVGLIGVAVVIQSEQKQLLQEPRVSLYEGAMTAEALHEKKIMAQARLQFQCFVGEDVYHLDTSPVVHGGIKLLFGADRESFQKAVEKHRRLFVCPEPRGFLRTIWEVLEGGDTADPDFQQTVQFVQILSDEGKGRARQALRDARECGQLQAALELLQSGRTIWGNIWRVHQPGLYQEEQLLKALEKIARG